jgi:hypothetical protein
MGDRRPFEAEDYRKIEDIVSAHGDMGQTRAELQMAGTLMVSVN